MTKYPLAVKLGTITPSGADVFSYAENEMVEDPLLEEHLKHFGINVASMTKVCVCVCVCVCMCVCVRACVCVCMRGALLGTHGALTYWPLLMKFIKVGRQDQNLKILRWVGRGDLIYIYTLSN